MPNVFKGTADQIESNLNKIAVIDETATDEQYPSAAAVKTYVDSGSIIKTKHYYSGTIDGFRKEASTIEELEQYLPTTDILKLTIDNQVYYLQKRDYRSTATIDVEAFYGNASFATQIDENVNNTGEPYLVTICIYTSLRDDSEHCSINISIEYSKGAALPSYIDITLEEVLSIAQLPISAIPVDSLITYGYGEPIDGVTTGKIYIQLSDA